MEYKRHFKVERIRDTEVDVADEEEVQKLRTVVLTTADAKITLSGSQDKITGFKTNDFIEVRFKTTQSELEV